MVVRATHPAFATAGWEAVRRMRFRPAERGGAPVRQRAALPFDFDIR